MSTASGPDSPQEPGSVPPPPPEGAAGGPGAPGAPGSPAAEASAAQAHPGPPYPATPGEQQAPYPDASYPQAPYPQAPYVQGQPSPQGQPYPPAAGYPVYAGQPGYAGYAPAYAPAPPKNDLAIWSLVLGLAGIVLSLTFLTGIPAVILGRQARDAERAGLADNGGLATAGIVLGWVSIGLGALLVVGLLLWLVAVVGLLALHGMGAGY